MNVTEVRVLDHDEQLPTGDGNVDVEVVDDEGRRWSATFYTLANVSSLMKRWRASGEYGGGLYFWGGGDAIVVETLDRETIERTIADLASTDDLGRAFHLLMTDDD